MIGMGLVIAVTNLKGGAGKTTLSVALAEAQAQAGVPTLLVDSDPQGSALRWADLAADDGTPLDATTVGLPTADLPRRLPALARGQESVVIDTPPGHLAIARASMIVSDVVLIACQPTMSDLDRALATRDVAAEVGATCAVVLTRVRLGVKSLSAAAEALESSGVHVVGVRIPQRESIAGAFGARPPALLLDLAREVLTEVESIAAQGE